MTHNDKNKSILILILVFIIIDGGYVLYSINKTTNQTPIVEHPAIAKTTTIEIGSLSNDGTPESSTTTTPYIASIEVTTEYPQFGNLSSLTKFLEVKTSLNAELKNNAEALYKKGLIDANKTLKGLEQFHRDGPLNFKWTLINDQKIYTVKNYLNDDTGIFSYATKSYVDMAGAHGTFFYTSESYDLNTGDKLTANDLFQEGYKKFLLQYLKDKVAAKSTDCLHCENLSTITDTVEKFITFDDFVLSKDGVTFLFSAYDLGSYAETASGNELFVPKTALSEYIKKDW